jgi:hypothetical protein
LTIAICATAAALRSAVEVAVLARLGGADRSGDTAGFFFADRFTFGTPLFRSALEAAIQGVAGVNGVLSIAYRQRGVTTGWLDLPTVFPLGADRILRIDNDPDWPERGTITVVVEGGR